MAKHMNNDRLKKRRQRGKQANLRRRNASARHGIGLETASYHSIAPGVSIWRQSKYHQRINENSSESVSK